VRRLAPTQMAMTVASATYPVMKALEGSLHPGEGEFLLSLIEMAEPNHILELGVMGGGSTLCMLRYLAAAGSAASLTSVDALSYYFHDRTKRLGFLVFENEPIIPMNWTLLGGYGASNMSSAPELEHVNLSDRYDFVFVDAHHGHPWASLDVLCLLPIVAPGSWIVLHDVALTLIDEKWACRGPQYLLQKWPGERWLSNSRVPNIGAIRLSDAGRVDAQRLTEILDIPWEYRLHEYWEEAIIKHLRSYLTDIQMDKIKSSMGRYRHLALG